MTKQLKISGSTLRSRSPEGKGYIVDQVIENIWPLIETGKYKPTIFQSFKMKDVHLAHELMESSLPYWKNINRYERRVIMNLHEYQAKTLLKNNNVRVLAGIPVLEVTYIDNAIDSIQTPVMVVKSKIHAGGRGAGKFLEIGRAHV